MTTIHNPGSFIPFKQPVIDSADVSSPKKTAVRETEKSGTEISTSSMVSVLLVQGKLVESQKSVAPDISAPAVSPDSTRLRKQFQDFSVRLQSMQVKHEQAGEVNSQHNSQKVPMDSADVSATATKGQRKDKSDPAVASDSSLLRQQFQESGGRMQNVQASQERASEAVGKSESHASPVGSIDFSAPNVQRQDKSAATGKHSDRREEQSAGEESQSKAGSGLLNGAMSAKAQLMVQMVQSQTKMRDADKTTAVESGKLSMKSTVLASDKEIASGKARRNELITSAASSFGMTAAGTAQSHRGIKTQKSALNNHKAPAMESQNRAMNLNHSAQVKTGSTLPGAEAAKGSTVKLAGDTSDRIQRDHAALSRPAQKHQQRQAEHEFELSHMQLDGQRQQQMGQAITTSAGAAGGLAGAQFGMDASQAQSQRMIAEGNTRIHDSTASQNEKEADAANALIAALLSAMQQAAASNADAASAVASNMAR